MHAQQDTSKIDVEWRIRGGRAEGSIIRHSDREKRTKIVFIDDRFQGRRPLDKEVTAAEIIRDTKPTEPGRGALIVRPIYEAEANALTEAELETKLIELIKAQPLSIADRVTIQISFRGWTGELVGTINTREDGPLGRSWRYTDTQNGRSFNVFNHEPGVSIAVFPITTSIRRARRALYVSSWERALTELGEPIAIEAPIGGKQSVIWRRDGGHRLSAEVHGKNLPPKRERMY